MTPDEIMKMECIVDFLQYYKSGDTIGPEVMGTLGQHFGRFALKAFNREDMKTAVQMIQSKLLVRNTLGQDMYSMKFDMGRCGW